MGWLCQSCLFLFLLLNCIIAANVIKKDILPKDVKDREKFYQNFSAKDDNLNKRTFGPVCTKPGDASEWEKQVDPLRVYTCGHGKYNCYTSQFITFGNQTVNMVFIEMGSSFKINQNCNTSTQQCANYTLHARRGPQNKPTEINGNFTLLTSQPGCPDDCDFYSQFGNKTWDKDAQNWFNNNFTVKLNDMFNYTGFELTLGNHGDWCGSIKDIDIFYYKCPSTTEQLVHFEELAAPDDIKKTSHSSGKCVSNAQRDATGDQIRLTCYSNGTYSTTGSCMCNAGYFKNSLECKQCVEGKFKEEAGNHACLKCGKFSKDPTSSDKTRIKCDCDEKYYRTEKDVANYSTDCYFPIGKPVDVKYNNIGDGSVKLTWTAPTLTDTLSDPASSNALSISYHLVCTNCPVDDDDIMKVFGKNGSVVDKTNFDVREAGSYATYQIQITTLVPVTLYGVPDSVEKDTTMTFRTQEGVPGVIRDFVPLTSANGNAKVTWKAPFALGGPNLMYRVGWGSETLDTNRTFISIDAEIVFRSYTVKVTPFVKRNGVEQLGRQFSGAVEVRSNLSLKSVIGGGVGVGVFIIVIVAGLFLIYVRRHPAYTQVVRMEDGTVKIPAFMAGHGQKLYVDPSSYRSIDMAVAENANELEKGQLRIGKLLGEGEFADVFEGSLYEDGQERIVAVKKLKDSATKSDREDLLSEAAILGQFEDVNVIHLEGALISEQPNMIVLEYMMHGALDKYLKENENKFSVIQLLTMARGVASGMTYLSEMGFIHRDLAARNILVDEQGNCKIADFGMSLEIKLDENYETRGGKIPVRWTAPEAIQLKKFTTASDVWSFGVLLWEIMSYGERPYWDWTNYEVLKRLNNGYRLPPPSRCPIVVHDMMMNSWHRDRTRRPNFRAIRDTIDQWLKKPAVLNDIAETIVKFGDSLESVTQNINIWLEAIGMGRYSKQFVEQGFATPRQILLLNMKDLETLGVGSLQHRNKILSAINSTKTHVETQLAKSPRIVAKPPKPMKF